MRTLAVLVAAFYSQPVWAAGQAVRLAGPFGQAAVWAAGQASCSKPGKPKNLARRTFGCSSANTYAINNARLALCNGGSCPDEVTHALEAIADAWTRCESFSCNPPDLVHGAQGGTVPTADNNYTGCVGLSRGGKDFGVCAAFFKQVHNLVRRFRKQLITAGTADTNSRLVDSHHAAPGGVPLVSIPVDGRLRPGERSLVLSNGVRMPLIGYGLGHLSGHSNSESLIAKALQVGYRSFDTSMLYDGTEAALGAALRASGVPRREVFISTKYVAHDDDETHRADWWPASHVGEAFARQLAQLQTSYVDLYMLHVAYLHEDLLTVVWPELERQYELGRIRALGVANADVATLDAFMRRTRIRPVYWQGRVSIYTHPVGALPNGWPAHRHTEPISLAKYAHERNITICAFNVISAHESHSTILSAMADPHVVAIARTRGVEPSKVLVRWALQSGFATLLGSSNPQHIASNLDQFGFELSASEMATLTALATVAESGLLRGSFGPRYAHDAFGIKRYLRALGPGTLSADGGRARMIQGRAAAEVADTAAAWTAAQHARAGPAAADTPTPARVGGKRSSERGRALWQRDGDTDCDGHRYEDIRAHYEQHGYAVVRPCSLQADADLMDATVAFTRSTQHALPGKTIQANDAREMNGWHTSRAVHRVATDAELLGVVSSLQRGAVPRPFQTLNFCRSPMKPLHSDVVHFDSLPKRGELMAAWVALEDIHTNAGPLTLYSGSHADGLNDFAALGVREPASKLGLSKRDDRASHLEYYRRYVRALRSAFEPRGDQLREMTLRKGQVLLWNGSLVHGSKRVLDENLTRLSQVTHYFFDSSARFWEPKNSRPTAGLIRYRPAPQIPLPAQRWPAPRIGKQRSRELAAEQPAACATILLNPTGGGATSMPLQGFGTCCRAAANGTPLIESMQHFLRAGGRHIDTADMYSNHAAVGEGLRRYLARGTLRRDELWITSKVWTPTLAGGAPALKAAVDRFLVELGVEYLDLVLLHKPLCPGVPKSKPTARQIPKPLGRCLRALWMALAEVQRSGKARAIGVSNFSPLHLQALLATGGPVPAVNQIEYHPYIEADARKTAEWCRQKGIAVVAHSPLGSSKMAADRSHLDGALPRVAAAHNRSVVQTLLRYSLDQNVSVVPGATSRGHIEENLAACERGFGLTPDERRALTKDAKPNGWQRG